MSDQLSKEERVSLARSAKAREQNWMKLSEMFPHLAQLSVAGPTTMQDLMLIKQVVGTVLAEVVWRKAEIALAEKGIVGDSFNSMIRDVLKDKKEVEEAIKIAADVSTGDVILVTDAGTQVKIPHAAIATVEGNLREVAAQLQFIKELRG